jgi:hypothetical protein
VADLASTAGDGAEQRRPANRAHNLRATFGEQGLEVVPRTRESASPAWRFGWQTSGLGRPGRMLEAG